MRRRWKTMVSIGFLLLVAGIGFDVVRGLMSGDATSAAPPDTPPPTPPPGALDPTSTAVRPVGAEWSRYLRQAPLTEGRKLPVLKVVDHNEKTLRIPAAGKPAVWAVLCGCRDCAAAGTAIADLGRRSDGQLRPILFVSNTAPYIWNRMEMSFGMQAGLVRDAAGDYFRRLRAPGSSYSRLPMVWGADRHGIVRFFARPPRESHAWVDELRETLGIRDVYALP